MPESRGTSSLNDMALWAAGLFEAGGAIGFQMSKDKIYERTHFYPYAAIGDEDQRITELLKNLFGGESYPVKKPYWQWIIRGSDFLYLLGSIPSLASFAPSRKKIISEILRWNKCPTLEGRAIIAMESRKRDRFEGVTKIDYTHLVTEPEFLAGVFDHKGPIYSEKYVALGPGYEHTRLSLSIKNTPLLEALKERFKGSYGCERPKDSLIIIKGQTTGKISRDLYRWRLFNFEELITQIQPHLLLRQLPL